MSSRLRNAQREPEPVENGDVRRSQRVRQRPQYFTEDLEDDEGRPMRMLNRKEKDSDFETKSESDEDSKKKKNGRKGPNPKKKTKYNEDSDSSYNASSSSGSSSGNVCLPLSNGPQPVWACAHYIWL